MQSMILSATATLAVPLLLTNAAAAQVTATATVIQPLTATAGQTTNSVPIGTNVVSGTTILANDSTRAFASSGFSFSLTSERSSANSVVSAGSPNPQTSATASGGVEIIYTSPVPILVEISMLVPAGPTSTPCSSRTARVEIVGNSSISMPSCPSGPYSAFCERSVRTRIDSMGLRLRLGSGVAVPNPGRGACPRIQDALALQFDVSPVPVGAPYGSSCGVALSSTADLLNPGIETIHVDGADPMGVLLIGDQQLSTTLGGFLPCPLLTNSLVGVPLAMDQNGDASLSFPVSQGPFFVQAATSDGATIRLSDGLRYP